MRRFLTVVAVSAVLPLLAAAPAHAGTSTRHLKEYGHGEVTSSGVGGGGSQRTVDGAIWLTGIGQGHYEDTWVQSCPEYDDPCTITTWDDIVVTAPDGSTLTMHGVFPKNVLAPTKGRFTVTHATGRFAHTTGSGTFTVVDYSRYGKVLSKLRIDGSFRR